MTDAAPEPVPLVAARFRDRVRSAWFGVGESTPFIVIFASQLPNAVVISFFPSLEALPRIGLSIVVGLVTLVVSFFGYVAVHPVPVVDGAAAELRRGRRRLAFASVDSAAVVFAVSRRHRIVGIRIGRSGAPQSIVLLREDERLLLDGALPGSS